MSIDGHSEPKLVSKLLLKVSFRELHNSTASPPEECGIKDARDADNTIIISDYTLLSIITTQLNNMFSQYKVMCGFECCISAKSMHSSLPSWSDCYF